MTVYELVEKLGGEIVRGIARVRQGDVYIVLGRINGDMMEMTAEGRALAEPAPADAADEVVDEKAAKKGAKKGAKKADDVLDDVAPVLPADANE